VNNLLALQNTRMIKTYVAIDPRVRPLILIIKHWAKQRQLNDAASGGTLSTYTWTCMVINFLQTRYPPILPNLHEIPHTLSNDNVQINGMNSSFCDDLSKLVGFGRSNHESLGGLLYAFFRKFAYEFDYATQVISVRSGKLLSRYEKGWNKGIESKRAFCIEEPFDTRRNLGNSADETSVKGLKLEFERAVNILLETRGNLDSLCRWYNNNNNSIF
jgi:DNA polymerase sigma